MGAQKSIPAGIFNTIGLNPAGMLLSAAIYMCHKMVLTFEAMASASLI